MFFATAFDEASADLLSELDVPAYKIASGDLRNTPLLRHVAAIGKPLIVSTGGATIEDVDRAVETVTAINPQLCLLQCTASYPASVEELELGVIATYRERYPELVVGLSDHQDGIAMAPVAYMLGARVIEKHFTASHTAKGTDHAFSLMPEGMRKLVRDLHRVPAAIGDGVKRPLPSEEAPLRKMGKQLVAARPLPAGHVLAEGDLVGEVACRGRSAAVPARRPRRHERSGARSGGRGGAHDRRRDRGCPRGGVVDGDVSDPLFDLSGRVARGDRRDGAARRRARRWRSRRAGCAWRSSTSRPRPRRGAPGLRDRARGRHGPGARVRRDRPRRRSRRRSRSSRPTGAFPTCSSTPPRSTRRPTRRRRRSARSRTCRSSRSSGSST